MWVQSVTTSAGLRNMHTNFCDIYVENENLAFKPGSEKVKISMELNTGLLKRGIRYGKFH